MDKQKKEPLIHITKRKMISKKHEWAIRLGSIVIALIVCAIITTITTHLNPFAVYASMWEGSFGTERKIWSLLKELSILLMISVALAPAFKMKFWNLGGGGQTMAGVLATAACMITLADKMPSGAIMFVSFVSALCAGALWAFIPAFCKAKWNTNETLSTLMMNYIATQIVAYYTVLWESPKGSGKIGIINQNSNIGWLPEIGNKYLLSILVALLVTGFLYIYIYYSKHGYEICVVGESERTANYVGIKVPKVIVRTMLVSGALCGLAGLLLVGGINHTITTTIAGGQGFTAIMVSWLAKFNPITMIFTSLLIIFLGRGAGEIATVFELNQSFSDILTGIILFFIIGCEFFIRYKLVFRSGKKEEVKNV